LRCIMIVLAWLASSGLAAGAKADASGTFATTMQSIMANLRAGTSYARTGNTSLAQIEIDEAVASWKGLREQPGAAPAPYRADALAAFFAEVTERLAAASRALGNGDNATAGPELLAARRAFHDLRHASGLYDLGDCIFEIAPAMETLRAAATRFGEGAVAGHAADTVSAAAVFRDRLQRCDRWADPDIAKQAEFRRLIDGAILSAGEISKTALAGDGALVHRYLIELQSYAQLLDFRFG
jgi:hypothetical protein